MTSRAKGARGERKARDLFRDAGFTARRGQQFSGGPDSPDVIVEELHNHLHIEVKHGKSLRIWEAIDQAKRDCGEKDWVVLLLRDYWEEMALVPAKRYIDMERRLLHIDNKQSCES